MNVPGASHAGHGGKIYLLCSVSAALFVTPPKEAAIATTVFLETDVVVTSNVADRAPEGMINFDGALAFAD